MRGVWASGMKDRSEDKPSLVSTVSTGVRSGASRIGVLCVDDSVSLTTAFLKLINVQPDMVGLGAVQSATDLLDALARHRPDVVLLDMGMAGRDPIEAIADAARLHPEVRMLVYSGHSDDVLTSRAIEAGAWGFVSKHEDPQRVLGVIRRVAAGEVVLSGKHGA